MSLVSKNMSFVWKAKGIIRWIVIFFQLSSYFCLFLFLFLLNITIGKWRRVEEAKQYNLTRWQKCSWKSSWRESWWHWQCNLLLTWWQNKKKKHAAILFSGMIHAGYLKFYDRLCLKAFIWRLRFTTSVFQKAAFTREATTTMAASAAVTPPSTSRAKVRDAVMGGRRFVALQMSNSSHR